MHSNSKNSPLRILSVDLAQICWQSFFRALLSVFCSFASWDIVKATGWWNECIEMSVHIHVRYHCSRSCFPEEIPLPGQVYEREVGMFSFCLFLSYRRPPTAEQLFYSSASRCKSTQHLPFDSKSPYPLSLNETTFSQNNTWSEYSPLWAVFWRCCLYYFYIFFLLLFKDVKTKQICPDIDRRGRR